MSFKNTKEIFEYVTIKWQCQVKGMEDIGF